MLKPTAKQRILTVRQRIGIMGIVLLFLTSLSGCSSVSAPDSTPTATAWQERSVALNRLSYWHINGKIAVRTPNDSGSATVDWMQESSRFNIALTAPLGVGGLKLTGQPGAVSLTTANGQRYTAASPEQLLAERWGWRLPVSNLNYWVRGLPAPQSPYQTNFDQYHRLSTLQQTGWTVQYLGYTRVGGLELPNRLTINSPALKTKIIIYRWDLGDGTTSG